MHETKKFPHDDRVVRKGDFENTVEHPERQYADHFRFFESVLTSNAGWDSKRECATSNVYFFLS